MNRLVFILCLILVGCGGTQGAPGNPGKDSDITPVQFCPGPSIYPSAFPEIGWCINGTIYAVYSANDGFLTMLPPGVYQSQAIGSSCTFIVLDNCGIGY